MDHLSRVLSLDGFKMNKIVVVHVAHPGFLGFLILGEKNEKYRFTSVLDCIFASGIHRETPISTEILNKTKANAISTTL